MPDLKAERGGVSQHGTITVGLTPVVAQAATLSLRSLVIQNLGPGKIYPGGVSVTTSNTIALSVGDAFVRGESADALYLVSDQANTVVVFFRELAP